MQWKIFFVHKALQLLEFIENKTCTPLFIYNCQHHVEYFKLDKASATLRVTT